MKNNFYLLLLLLTGSFSLNAEVTVTKTLPMDKATGITLSPNISIRFSESINHYKDSCYINGKLVFPTSITSSVAIFKPTFLSYSTTYTMDIPAGTFKTTASGELTPAHRFTFTTIDRPAAEARTFDAIVAADGSGNYTSMRAAILAAPEGRTKPWLIFVKKGTYTELIRNPATKPYIHLIGEDKDSTILKFAINADASSSYGAPNFPDAEGESPVLVVKGADFYAENIQVINAFEYDFQSGPQALAISSDADRLAFQNCAFYSFQDTWMTAGSGHTSYRHYTRHSYIEGAVDFIYNAGDCYFDSCTLGLARNGSVITAPSHTSASPYGYVFMNCQVVSSKPGTLRSDNYFGRPWHNNPKVRFINTSLSNDITIKPEGWIQKMGGLPEIFADYNTMDQNGKPVDLSKRNNYYYTTDDAGNVTGYCYARSNCTPEEVASLTPNDVLTGSDGWRPDLSMITLPPPTIKIATLNSLSWEANPYAICYLISKNSRFVQFTTGTTFSVDDPHAVYTIRAANEWGGLGEPLTITPALLNGLTNASKTEYIRIADGKLLVGQSVKKATVTIYSVIGQTYLTTEIAGSSEIKLPKGEILIISVIQENDRKTLKCLL
jgi:pectin methylesterase-like acyl-CoA thioesterase